MSMILHPTSVYILLAAPLRVATLRSSLFARPAPVVAVCLLNGRHCSTSLADALPRVLLVWGLLFIAPALSAQTLPEFLQIALDHHPGIRATQTEALATEQKVAQVRALPDPSLDLAILPIPMMLPMGNQLGSITLMQMVPWPGTRSRLENEVTAEVALQQQRTLVTENEVAYQVKAAWYPLLQLEEQIRIRRNMLRVLESFKEIATFQFEQGQGSLADILRTDILLDEMRTQINLLERKRQPLEIAFKRLLNLPDDATLIIDEQLPVPKPILPESPSLDNNPNLAVYDKQIELASARMNVVENARKPSIGAGLQYMPLVRRQDTDPHFIPPNTGRDMFMPMLSMNLPVWQKKYDAAQEALRLTQQAYTEQKRQAENLLSSQVAMTHYELESTQLQLELLQRQTEKTQQSIDLLLASYQNAGQGLDEVLRLQQQLYNYQLETVQLQTDYQLALAKLDYLLGNL